MTVGRLPGRWAEVAGGRPSGPNDTMPAGVRTRTRTGWAWGCLLLACGTGTITAPGGDNGTPPPPTNHDPVFLVQPGANSSTLPEGQTAQLSVTADDPDGDSLGYAWTQLSPATPQGTFSSRTARNPTWIAPPVTSNTPVVLQVSINDGHGGSAVASFTLTVIQVQQNQPPTVSAISVPTTPPVAGDDVPLSVTATDPDGDPLTIVWTQTAPATQGTFSSTSTASVIWRSPTLSTPTVTFSFQVTVSDGVNAAVQRTATVQVKAPSYAADIQPIWDAQCISCHPSDGSLDLTATNSYAQLVDRTQTTSGGCSGEKLVDTGTPNASSLPKWLGGTTCGSRMPEGSPPLVPGDLVKVQSWIDSGALQN
jgi:hypothetical protein